MAWSELYATGSSYWKFKYNVYELNQSGTQYTVRFDLYFQHSGKNAYFLGESWKFTLTVGSISKDFTYTAAMNWGTTAWGTDLYLGTYDVTYDRGAYSLSTLGITTKASFSENSGSYVSPHSSAGGTTNITLSANATSVSAPTINSVTDNGNNTFTVKVTMGNAGANNSANNVKLVYSYSNSDPKSGDSNVLTLTNGINSSGVFTFNVNTSASDVSSAGSKTVYFAAYTVGTLGDSSRTSITSTTLKYYLPPDLNYGALVCTSGYRQPDKVRMKDSITLTWVPPTNPNSVSIVSEVQIRISNKSGAVFYDVSLPISPASKVLEISSLITTQITLPNELRIYYSFSTKNGAGTRLYSAISTPQRGSLGGYTILDLIKGSNMKIKNTTWKSGTAYIKVNSVWKPSSAVYYKNNSVWKQSV